VIPLEALRYYRHFAGVPEKYLKDIAMMSSERAFKAGERLFREGNTATHLMFIKAGEIHIVYTLGDGREVIADTLVTGDTLAWSALLEPHNLTASGVASKDGALIQVEAVELRRICDENIELGYQVVKEIARTLRSRLSAMRVQAAASLAETAL
jgi:CRP-like cAMP-binding protein